MPPEPQFGDEPCLSCQPNRSVSRSVSHIFAALHGFEDQALLESQQGDLEIFAVSLTVIEDIVVFAGVSTIRQVGPLRR
jgi:hypothetical protein